jgi:hypothetical protein
LILRIYCLIRVLCDRGSGVEDTVGRILNELQKEILNDDISKLLVYSELYKLTVDKNNQGLSRILIPELSILINIFSELDPERNMIKKQIDRFAY